MEFHALDYTVLLISLTVYLGIGIYFGRKRQGSQEYTSAKGELGVIPVGLSLAVTNISVITIQVCFTSFLLRNAATAKVVYTCQKRKYPPVMQNCISDGRFLFVASKLQVKFERF